MSRLFVFESLAKTPDSYWTNGHFDSSTIDAKFHNARRPTTSRNRFWVPYTNQNETTTAINPSIPENKTSPTDIHTSLHFLGQDCKSRA